MHKVLLVEDEPMLMDMYKTAFTTAADLNVLSASDVDGAVSIIKQEKPELVLLDVRLGEQSGLDVLKQIKADTSLASVSFFVLTNFDTEELAKQSVALGAEKYLIKSQLTPLKLLGVVKEKFKIQ